MSRSSIHKSMNGCVCSQGQKCCFMPQMRLVLNDDAMNSINRGEGCKIGITNIDMKFHMADFVEKVHSSWLHSSSLASRREVC